MGDNSNAKVQKLYLKGDDEQNTFQIVDNIVNIYSSASSALDYKPISSSNKIKVKPAVKYYWQHQYYIGKLICRHRFSPLIAYCITNKITASGENGDVSMVRLRNTETGQKLLLKSFNGRVVTMGFAIRVDPILAVLDISGFLHVFRIFSDSPDSDLNGETLLIFRPRHTGSSPSKHQTLAWCPWDAGSGQAVPLLFSAPAEDLHPVHDDPSMLLAMSYGSRVEVVNIAMAVQLLASRPTLSPVAVETISASGGDAESVTSCCWSRDQLIQLLATRQQQHEETGESESSLVYAWTADHREAVTAVAVSRDAGCLASAGLDGQVCIYRLKVTGRTDGEAEAAEAFCQLTPILVFSPHDGQPLHELLFTDGCGLENNGKPTWSHLITGGKFNRELRLWSCTDWTCSQVISFHNPPAPSVCAQSADEAILAADSQQQPTLVVALDWSASLLVVSDITRRVFYVIEISSRLPAASSLATETNGCEAGAGDRQVVRFTSISEFLLSTPCFLFAVGNSDRKASPGTDTRTESSLSADGDLVTLEIHGIHARHLLNSTFNFRLLSTATAAAATTATASIIPVTCENEKEEAKSAVGEPQLADQAAPERPLSPNNENPTGGQVSQLVWKAAEEEVNKEEDKSNNAPGGGRDGGGDGVDNVSSPSVSSWSGKSVPLSSSSSSDSEKGIRLADGDGSPSGGKFGTVSPLPLRGRVESGLSVRTSSSLSPSDRSSPQWDSGVPYQVESEAPRTEEEEEPVTSRVQVRFGDQSEEEDVDMGRGDEVKESSSRAVVDRQLLFPDSEDAQAPGSAQDVPGDTTPVNNTTNADSSSESLWPPSCDRTMADGGARLQGPGNWSTMSLYSNTSSEATAPPVLLCVEGDEEDLEEAYHRRSHQRILEHAQEAEELLNILAPNAFPAGSAVAASGMALTVGGEPVLRMGPSRDISCSGQVMTLLTQLLAHSKKQDEQMSFLIGELSSTQRRLDQLVGTHAELAKSMEYLTKRAVDADRKTASGPDQQTNAASNANQKKSGQATVQTIKQTSSENALARAANASPPEWALQLLLQFRTQQGDFANRFSSMKTTLASVAKATADLQRAVEQQSARLGSDSVINDGVGGGGVNASRLERVAELTVQLMTPVLQRQLKMALATCYVNKNLRDALLRPIQDCLASLPNAFTEAVVRAVGDANFSQQLAVTTSATLSAELVGVYRNLLQELFLPQLEKTVNRLFQELSSLFQTGTQQYLQQVCSRPQPLPDTGKLAKSITGQLLPPIQKSLREAVAANQPPVVGNGDQHHHQQQQPQQRPIQPAKSSNTNLMASSSPSRNKSSSSMQLSTTTTTTTADQCTSFSLETRPASDLLLAGQPQQMPPPAPSPLGSATAVADTTLWSKKEVSALHAGQVQLHVRQGELDKALELALISKNQALVLDICNEIDVNRLFNSGKFRVPQNVLLSLIQQLSSGDLGVQSDIKLRYIQEAVLNLDQNNKVTREHGARVAVQLIQRLEAFQVALSSQSTATSVADASAGLAHRARTLLRTTRCMLGVNPGQSA